MKNNYFNIVVKNLLKHKNKLIEIDKIKKILEKILDSEYSDQKLYKIIYHLKNREYLQSLKKDILLVKDPEKQYSDEQLLEMYYRNILKKHCNQYIKGNRYIGGLKALELNISSYDIPEEVLIVNQNKQCTEKVMFNKQILLKTYTTNEKKIFSTFYKLTKKVYIKNNVFPIANIELAILESLYNLSLINKGYTEELIKKILRKNKKYINPQVREKIIKTGKHHTSINRLYRITLSIDPLLGETIKGIIKKHSYFIG
ncbi:hypothetical protein K9M48_05075 [Candidatus Gracilibacteria bacterium]|nr:hypothetical protein [Candidatus Gracilibacteria bacterium]